ncbi:MAG TPA: hypothetical protein PKG60_07950 [Spirochaetota bacterium]|nr:hypothetical protein [Spirochaetota bacterium]
MDEKKKVLLSRLSLLFITAALILLIALPAAQVLNSSYSVIIKDKDMNYYRGRNIFICGNTIICRKDSESVKDKSMIPDEDISRYSFKILSMKKIISIEILQDDDAAPADVSAVNPQYLGKFKIQLQGHEGILILGVSKEHVYGTVRFPQWGKGQVEYLKGTRISSGEVRFTRSASTPEEIRRLGANYLFKQKFSGTYSASGKVIKGYMINDRGEKHEWEAVRK